MGQSHSLKPFEFSLEELHKSNLVKRVKPTFEGLLELAAHVFPKENHRSEAVLLVLIYMRRNFRSTYHVLRRRILEPVLEFNNLTVSVVMNLLQKSLFRSLFYADYGYYFFTAFLLELWTAPSLYIECKKQEKSTFALKSLLDGRLIRLTILYQKMLVRLDSFQELNPCVGIGHFKENSSLHQAFESASSFFSGSEVSLDGFLKKGSLCLHFLVGLCDSGVDPIRSSLLWEALVAASIRVVDPVCLEQDDSGQLKVVLLKRWKKEHSGIYNEGFQAAELGSVRAGTGPALVLFCR